MAYDRNKVNFTDDEHSAAQAADQIYEAASAATEGGLNLDDLSVVLQVLGPGKTLISYLTNGTRAEMAKKLVALGVMLERDNDFLAGVGGGVQ